jgi:hypothetical protein
MRAPPPPHLPRASPPSPPTAPPGSRWSSMGWVQPSQSRPTGPSIAGDAAWVPPQGGACRVTAHCLPMPASHHLPGAGHGGFDGSSRGHGGSGGSSPVHPGSGEVGLLLLLLLRVRVPVTCSRVPPCRTSHARSGGF